MLSCKQTSELVSQSLDRRLSLGERLAVRLHLAICSGCARVRRQLQFLHRAIRELPLRLDHPSSLALSAEARTRIRHLVERENQ